MNKTIDTAQAAKRSLLSNSAAIRGDEHFWIDTGWFGVLFAMSMFWGLGLAVHTIASIANRGFEELPKA